MSKLYRARSLLYRRKILQENIRWKALDEIYKIYMLFHRSDLNIAKKKIIKLFRIFWQKIAKIRYFCILFIDFAQILMKICRNFADIKPDILENVEIFQIF